MPNRSPPPPLPPPPPPRPPSIQRVGGGYVETPPTNAELVEAMRVEAGDHHRSLAAERARSAAERESARATIETLTHELREERNASAEAAAELGKVAACQSAHATTCLHILPLRDPPPGAILACAILSCAILARAILPCPAVPRASLAGAFLLPASPGCLAPTRPHPPCPVSCKPSSMPAVQCERPRLRHRPSSAWR